MAASADAASTEPAVATATTSFRLLNTVAYLLPPFGVRSSNAQRPHCDVKRTLLAAIELCNAELFVVGGFR
jgi:hypothetical protein